MTHKEELLNAKTKADLFSPLYELITDVRFDDDFDIFEWLDSEKDVRQTIRRAVINMAEGRKRKEKEVDSVKLSNEPIGIGDRVRILDGSNIPDYAGNWVKAMERHVGEICTVSGFTKSFKDGVLVAENIYTWDVRGLEKV